MAEMDNFVNREFELKELNHILERVSVEGGKFFFLFGNTGVGKSELAERFLNKNEKSNFSTIRTSCFGNTKTPGHVIIELIRGLTATHLNIILEHGLDQILKEIRDFENLFSVHILPVSMGNENLPPKQKFFSDEHIQKIITSVTSLLKSFSKFKKTIFFVDDAQAIDSISVKILCLFALHIYEFPVLFLFIYRKELNSLEEDRQDSLLTLLNFLVKINAFNGLRVDELSFENTKKLIKNIINERISNEFIRDIYDFTEGNPLYTEELINELYNQKKISLSEDKYPELKLNYEVLPSTLCELFMERYSKLPDEEKKVLEWCSVNGGEISRQILLKFDEIPKDKLQSIILNLINKQYLLEDTVNKDVYRITSPLISEFIYGTIKERTRKMHAYMITLLEETSGEDVNIYDLAHHYISAEYIEKGFDFCLRAGEKAYNNFEPQKAMRYYQDMAEVIEKNEESRKRFMREYTTLKMKIGDMAYTLGYWDYATKSYDTAQKLASEHGYPRIICETLQRVAKLKVDMGYIEESENIYKKALELAISIAENSIVADCYRGIGYAQWRKDNYDEAMKNYDSALKYARYDDDITQGKIHIEIGNVLNSQGDLNKGLLYYVKAIKFLEKTPELREIARAYNNIGDIHMRRENWDKALFAFNQCIKIATKLQDSMVEAWARFNIAEVHIKNSKVDEGLKNLESAANILMKTKDRIANCAIKKIYALAYAQLGDFQKAELFLNEALTGWKTLKLKYNYIETLIDYSKILKNNGKDFQKYINEASGLLEKINSTFLKENLELLKTN